MRQLTVALSIVALIACGGCVIDDRPGAARIRCGSTADCPSNHHCPPALGFCVSNDAVDDLPVVRFVSTSPLAGRGGVTFDVQLDVQGAALEDPTVAAVRTADAAPVASFALVDRVGSTLHFQWTSQGTEPEGLARLEARFFSPLGTPTTEVSRDLIRLDFTPPNPVLLATQLVPAPGSPLTAVSALGPGATLAVLLTFDEAVQDDGGAASPHVESVPPGLSFARVAQPVSGLARFEATLPAAGFPEGPLDLVATATDLVGNTGNAPLSAVADVDTTIPVEPAVDLGFDGGLVHERAPTGVDETAAVPTQWLRVGSAAVTEPGTLRVLDTASNVQLALIPCLPDAGEFSARLTGTDSSRISVSFFDRAGNASLVRRVRNVRWRVTPSDAFAPIVEAELRQVHTPARYAQSADLPDNPALARRDVGSDGGTQSIAGGLRWLRRDATLPTLNGGAGAPFGFYDAHRGRGVLVSQGPAPLQEAEVDLWSSGEWLPFRPTDPEGDGDPSSRGSGSITWDSWRGVGVLFSGMNSANDTWEWSGSSWKLIVPSDPEGDGNPVSRGYAGMDFDADRGVAVLFGGNASAPSAINNEVWEWNGKSWRRVLPTGGPPVPRQAPAAFFYDRVGHAFVLHGGWGAIGATVLADTWELVFDGGTANWVDRTQAGFPRTASCSAWDSTHQVGVTVGGIASSGRTNDVTVWTPANHSFSALPTPANAPGTMGYCGLFFDPVLGRMVVADALSGTYTLGVGDGGADWKPVADPGNPPSPRSMHASSWVPGKGTLIAGGTTALNPAARDAWLWDGTVWRDAGTIPGGRAGGSLTRAPGASRAWLYGGVGDAGSDELWAWDEGFSFERKLPGCGARSQHSAAAFAPDGGAPWLYLWGGLLGGVALGSGCVFDGTTVSPTTDAGAPRTFLKPSAAATGLDPASVTQFGTCASTVLKICAWQFRPTTGWSAPIDPLPLPAFDSFAASTDPNGQTIALVGTQPPNTDVIHTWAAGAWAIPFTSDPEPAGRPFARASPSVAWDALRRRQVMFGGAGAAGPLNDLWELARAELKPAMAFHVRLAAAQLEPGTVPMRLTAKVAARAQSPNLLAPGADLMLWLREGWTNQPALMSSTALTQPVFGDATVEVTDPAVLAELVRNGQPPISAVLVSRGENATSAAQLDVDYFELVLEYRLP